MKEHLYRRMHESGGVHSPLYRALSESSARLPETEGIPRQSQGNELLATVIAADIARNLFMTVVGYYAAHRDQVMPGQMAAQLQGLRAAWPRRNLAELSTIIEIFIDDLGQCRDLFGDRAVLQVYGEAVRFVKHSLPQ